MPDFNHAAWLHALCRLPVPRRAVLVSVRASAGSTPRRPGARMLVTGDACFDSIGGGHLEWKAIATARLWLAEPGSSAAWRSERLTLGPALGQCCGGANELLYERVDLWSEADYAARLQRYQGELDQLPHLYLFGAGHVGTALVQVLKACPCRITWCDEREHLFPSDLPPQIRCEATDTPEAVIAAAEAGSYFLVMTHHHGLDLRLSEHILRRADAAWFGLIGSRSKRASFLQRLHARGIAPDASAAMTCPIGLAGLHGKEPGVIAVAVAAQLLQIWEKSIHPHPTAHPS